MTEADANPAHPGLPATTAEAAATLGAELVGPGDLPIRRLDIMDRAGPGSLTFIRTAAFAKKWPECGATAAIVSRDVEMPAHPDTNRAVLIVPNADRAVHTLLTKASAEINRPLFDEGHHPTAFIHPTAQVDPTATIGPFCAVGHDAVVGPGALLEAHVSVGALCRVGARTRVHEGVVLRPMTMIGEDSLLHPGSVIGADGFGFDRDENNIPVFIPHIAGVTIGNRVVVGGNCSIDRGKFSDTIIGDDVKIDNLTQIGHATHVGRGTVICGCCALGGSCRIGDYVTIGGGVHMPDNVTVEDGAILAGGAFVAGDIDASEPWMGHPARPRTMWLKELRAVKTVARLRQELKDTVKTVQRLAGRLQSLDGQSDEPRA